MTGFFIRTFFYAGMCMILLACSVQKSKPSRISVADSAGHSSKNYDSVFKYSPSRSEAAKDQRKQKVKKTPKTWKPSSLDSNRVRLFVGKNQVLPVKSVHSTVKIDGFRARVVLDYHFYNPNSQRLEGTFQLRLPNGASPYYLAFGLPEYSYMDKAKLEAYVEKNHRLRMRKLPLPDLSAESLQHISARQIKNLKQAHVVPQKQAARAYHATVRRRVDPALLEWTGAGVFNGRVYPLEPRSLHRVVIAYDVDMIATPSAMNFNFNLPKQSKRRFVQFDIANSSRDITINGSKITRRQRGRLYFASANPEQSLFRVSVAQRSDRVIAIKSNHRKTGGHFALRVTPNLPKRRGTIAASRAVFVLDTSLSHNGLSFNRSVKLLHAILENNPGIEEFSVLTFNVRSSWWQRRPVVNNANNRARLKRWLNSLALEGATDLEAALTRAISRRHSQPPGTNYFLISDGAITWGNSNHPNIIGKISKLLRNSRLFVYSTAQAGVNTSLMTGLANRSNGAYYAVHSDDQLSKASRAFNHLPWRISRVRVNDASDVLIQGRPDQIYPGQYLTIAGRGNIHKRSKLSITFTRGKQVVSRSYSLTNPIHSKIAVRQFGLIAVDQMQSLQLLPLNKTAQSFAIEYRVVGKNTTLLMLDGRRDYEQFNIKTVNEPATALVNQTNASRYIAQMAKKRATIALSQKQRLLHELMTLAKTPGVNYKIDENTLGTIRQLPAKAFTLTFNSTDGSGSTTLKSNTPATYRSALAKKDKNDIAYIREYKRRSKKRDKQAAILALSNLVELNPGNYKVLHQISFHLIKSGMERDAYYVFQKMIRRRPYEPYPYLAMARLANRMRNPELAYLYYSIVRGGHWDSRFNSMKRIAMLEQQVLIKNHGGSQKLNSLLSQAKKSSLKTYPDFMVTLEWNTDGNNMTLRTIQPDDQKVKHQPTFANTLQAQPETSIISNDWQRSQGPITYVAYRPAKGHYAIGLRYRKNNTNQTRLNTEVLVTVYRNIGKSDASITHKVITLTKLKGRKWFWNDFIGDEF